MGGTEDWGKLLPEERNIKLNRLLEEKIATMQRIIDEHQRYKALHEQAVKEVTIKDKMLEEMRTKNGALEIRIMEVEKTNYDLRQDLARMGEVETRDLNWLHENVISGMTFYISPQQAKSIGGVSIFAKEKISLKFDGATGALMKCTTDTDKEWSPPAEKKAQV